MNKQVNAIISLKDKFSKPLLKMSGNVDKLNQKTYDSMRSINKWSKGVEKSVDKAIKASFKWAKRGAVLLGGLSIKKGFDGVAELDGAARKVKSIAGDSLDLPQIKKDLLDLSGTLGKSVTELGDSWYNAISASVPIEDTLMAVEKAHKLSVAGFTNDDAAMKLLASTMNTFGLEGSESYDRIGDLLLMTQNKGIILVDEMTQLYGKISPLSKALGVSFEEQSAAMALFTKKGLTSPQATTGYGRILDRFMTKTGKDGANTLASIGLSEDFFSAKNLAKKGFANVMTELNDAVKGDMDKIAKLFPNINAKLAEAMFSGDGMDMYKEILEDMMNPEEALEKAYQIMENSIPRKMEVLKNRLETLNTKLYTEEAGGIGAGGIRKILDDIIDWINNNEDKVLEFMRKVNKGIEDIFEVIKDVVLFLIDNKETIGEIVKILAIAYGVFKGIKGLGNVLSFLKDIKTVKEGLELGSITAAITPKQFLLVLAVIYLIIQAIQYLKENWDDLKKDFPVLNEALQGAKKVIIWVITKIPALIQLIIDSFLFLKDVFGPIFSFVLEAILGVFNLVLGVIKSIFFVTLGLWRVVLGAVTLDSELIGQGIGDIKKGLFSAWEGISTTLEKPLNAILSIDEIEGPIRKIFKKWQEVRDFLSKPIFTRIEQKNDWKSVNKRDPRNRMDKNYKGTPNWKGGLTEIHERGAEVVDLPSGSRIYPHDKSLNLAYNKGAIDFAGVGVGASSSGNVNFGDVNVIIEGGINSELDINQVGHQIVKVIKGNLKNI